MTPANYTDVQVDSAPSLMSALVQQPVSIAIEADQTVFQARSGVLASAWHGALTRPSQLREQWRVSRDPVLA